MISGVLAGAIWALETISLGIAMDMSPFISTDQAVFLAPFVSTFLHDALSSLWVTLYNIFRGNIKEILQVLKSKNGKAVMCAAVIGGPIGMTGYVLSINYLGTSIGAVASAMYPAIGALLAYIFLKEDIPWYRWIFIGTTLLGVFGLSYASGGVVKNLYLGFLGAVMCSLGWGVEAVILATSMKDENVKQEYALQIRQTTSAIVYGAVILPFLKGWKFTFQLFTGKGATVILVIAVAAFFATTSYLCYYKTIVKIGAAKAMALNVTYSAWSVIFTIVILRNTSVISFRTIFCSVIVLVFSILSAVDFRKRKI